MGDKGGNVPTAMISIFAPSPWMAGSTGWSTVMQASLLSACSPEGVCNTCVTSPSLSPNASRRAAQGGARGLYCEKQKCFYNLLVSVAGLSASGFIWYVFTLVRV